MNRGYSLGLIAFVSGAALMAIEIVAARIMAPYFGNSIVVWSSLIGVILAAMSLGYWKGGKLADRNPTFTTLSFLLILAAVLTAFIALDKNACLTLVSRLSDIRIAAIAGDVILFAPVSFVLAMVSPYVVRLKMKEVGLSGETVGGLYAVSTVGSIVGTFAAGFVLLALIGSTAILLSIAGILLLVSLLTSAKTLWGMRAIAAVFVIGCAVGAPRTSIPVVQGTPLLETDTHYNHYLVYDGVDPRTQRPIRSLFLDFYTRQSSVFRDNDDDFVVEYLKYFRLADHFNPGARRHLLLGGGAFTFAKDLFRRNPARSLDIVELDPRLEGIARAYFGLTSYPNLSIVDADARMYLNQPGHQYDVIYIDTFGSAAVVPFYMTTQETARRIYERLTPGGLVLMNLLSAIDGPKGQFLRAELVTYRSVFPRVELFPLGAHADDFQNIVLVAFKDATEPSWTSNDPKINIYLARRWVKPVERDTPILTDDFAPVEIYLRRTRGF